MPWNILTIGFAYRNIRIKLIKRLFNVKQTFSFVLSFEE